MRSHFIAATVFVLMTSGAQGPDPARLGPQIGERVADFTLPDQQGVARPLRSMLGPKGAVLVFFRSADWWPYCKVQLVELQGRLDQLKREGLSVVAVSYDPVSVLADFARRRGITFPLVSDAGSAVIKQYGLLNTTIAEGHPTFGIPFPGTFIVDANGVVTSRHFEAAYQERNTIASVLVKLGAKLDLAGTRVTAPHLTAVTYVTDRDAAPGTHFSVVLDVTPADRIHVYAPGVSGGYKPITLTIATQPGVVNRAVQFPRADDYFFRPLNEHVAVYQRPFRIVQDLEIDPAPQSAAALADRSEMKIAGTLDYQACDDKVCFNPQSVPLRWTIGLKPLDRERVSKQ